MGAASGVRPYDSGYVIHATCGANMCKIHLWIPQLLFFVPKLAKTSSFFLGVLFDLKVSTGFIQKRRHSNIFIYIFHPGKSEFNKNSSESTISAATSAHSNSFVSWSVVEPAS